MQWVVARVDSSVRSSSPDYGIIRYVVHVREQRKRGGETRKKKKKSKSDWRLFDSGQASSHGSGSERPPSWRSRRPNPTVKRLTDLTALAKPRRGVEHSAVQVQCVGCAMPGGTVRRSTGRHFVRTTIAASGRLCLCLSGSGLGPC